MTKPVLRPTDAQIAAADPEVSAWVSANAGSGKTRVLTQRVARLLLAGSPPERILCLTYTRAAAAEMQSRLFDMLGGWALAPDARLGAELAALEGRATAETDAARLAEARRLFARALETPGGLKIQTIHAFCDAVLRRFPLEAGVSPRFEVMDDRASATLLARLRADLAAAAEAAGGGPFDAAAGRLNESDVDLFVTRALARRAVLGQDGAGQRISARFGVAAQQTPAEAAEAAMDRLDRAGAERLAAALSEHGKKTDIGIGAALAAALAQEGPAANRAEAIAGAILTKDGKARSLKGFPSKGVRAALPEAEDLAVALSDWALDWHTQRNAVATAARARDLAEFAGALLGRYAAAKTARGLLDFDDLVEKVVGLLTRSEMRGWVLYKLDAGIDHLLVDEAQDTSPAQWSIVEALTEEFTAGEGARGPGRTLFVVGDEKQSIYSFQGADPESFGTMRSRLGARLEDAARPLATPALETSFRSAPGVLSFVDRVFAGATGLSSDARPVRHVAHRAADPARVDLWDPVEPPVKPEPGPWEKPVDTPLPEGAPARLARLLAAEIARMIAEDTLPPRDGKQPRRVGAGDILVLVRARGVLDRLLVAELKAAGVPVAGADRLRLADGLATRDLLAAVKAAIRPEDDLSLAALLRSPLADVDEAALFDLAHGRGRGRSLAAALAAARDRHPREADMLADLAARADYLRPYEFLERILVHHDGQRRLRAQLGPESGDLIDALLDEALLMEREAVPTLAGFVDRIETGDRMVKREMEQGADAVRVMTIHGAKGLEAPVVVLPDLLRRPPGPRGPQLLPDATDPDLVLWLAAAKVDDPVAAKAREAEAARSEAERERLLYVALTRAEDWLILCGAGQPPSNESEDRRWYPRLAAAMEDAGGRRLEGPGELGLARLGPDPVPAAELATSGSGGAAAPAREGHAETAGGPSAHGGPRISGTAPPAAPATPTSDGTPPSAGPATDGEAPDGGVLPPPPAPREPRPRRLRASALLTAAVLPGADRSRPEPARDAPAQGSEAEVAPPGPGTALEPPARMSGTADPRAHGRAVHLYLERLGSRPAEARAALAGRLLAAEPDLDAAARSRAAAEAEAVLAAPFAAAIFGPEALAEAGLALALPGFGNRPMIGRADRLVVTADRVRVIDFKTDAAPPAEPGGVAPAYLAQLGAYAAALRAVFPGRGVTAELLWTAAPRLMPLPEPLLASALAAARAEAS